MALRTLTLGHGIKRTLGNLLLFGFGRRGELERAGVDSLGNRTATNALCANPQGLVCPVGRRDVDLLQVGLELPPRDTGNLRAYTAEVFGFTPMSDRIAHAGLLSTNLTFTSHPTNSLTRLLRGSRETTTIPVLRRNTRGDAISDCKIFGIPPNDTVGNRKTPGETTKTAITAVSPERQIGKMKSFTV